jgi:hypothetical protein
MTRWAHTPLAALMGLCSGVLLGQVPPKTAGPRPDPLTESGKVLEGSRSASFIIHLLPPSSFPDLPAPVAELLTRRDCLIPQTYAARRPENLIHASLERRGSSDWAVLCSAKGMVSLLVVFSSVPNQATILATVPETKRLQAHDTSGVLGFNWGIDGASPQRVHDAQAGMMPRPAPIDHDALADSVVEQGTMFHFYAQGKWTVLDVPE